jgi:hypothetical protein
MSSSRRKYALFFLGPLERRLGKARRSPRTQETSPALAERGTVYEFVDRDVPVLFHLARAFRPR